VMVITANTRVQAPKPLRTSEPPTFPWNALTFTFKSGVERSNTSPPILRYGI